MGTKVLCGNPDHVPQFRPVSDVLRDIVRYYVIWACRSGSKTFLYGGLDSWVKSCSKARYETRLLGGSKDQSLLSYEAMKIFRDETDPLNSRLVRDIMQTKAEFINKSKVSILTASMTAVRGPHPQALKLDEVDEIDAEVYEAALSQPTSKYGHKAVLGMFSTNHNIMGQMDKALANAKERGHAIYKYCVWECLESCRDYNCSTCKLAALCPGKQMKGADGYYSIEDFIGKLETLSMSMLSRDWLGIKVGLGDTVYEQEWNEDRNLCSVSLRQVPVKLSVDFGGVSPFSVGVWQEAPTELGGKGTWIRVTELYMCSEGAYEGDTKNREGSVTNAQVIKRALMAPWAKLVDEIIPDNSRPDSIQEWREAFPHAKIIIVTKDIDGMIDRVKSALKPILGAPKMLINRICLHWRQEVLMYAVKNDKPIDKNNHCYDDQTEILTEHGWKLFRDLDRTERVASLDGDRGLIWVQPSNYVDYGHEGHMFRYSNRHFGFCVTPNHNMLAVRQFDAKKLKRYNPTFVPVVNIRTAVGINNKGRRKQASCWWIPMRCIPENKGSGNVPVDGYFLGFWLAEGCKSISGFGAKYVHVDNTNLDLLDKATKRAGYHQKPYMASSGCHRVSIRSDELYDLLPKQRSWEKRIPRWFMENADLYQLFQLYEGMMDGDGCWQKASSHYNTCSEGLAGDFQELLIRIGKYGTVRQIGNIGDVSMMHGREITSKHNQYRVIVNDNGSVYKKLDGRKLERIHYSGRIYCVVVEPHHTIMVRRNGSTMWCGQTMDDTGYFALAKLGEEEGVYIGTTKKDVMPE